MSKQSIVAIIIAVAAAILIVVLASIRSPGGTDLGGGTEVEPQGPATRETLPRNVVIVVPGAGEKTEEGVAVPESVIPAPPHRGGASQRFFNVAISAGMFEPEEIRAFLGDTVRIDVTAVDGNYDYSQPDYGFKVVLQKGETKFTQFDATAAGRFTIFCQSCGGPEKGPVGFLVVAPRQ